MKALVLCGGSGTRLRPFTQSMPKQLMPIANRPILSYCLDTIRDVGVTDVALVVGEKAEQIEAHVGDGSALGLQVTYVRQAAPLGLADCVRVARGFLGDEDFLMYLGDNMLVGSLSEAAESFRARRPAAKVLVVKVGDPQAYGVAEVDAAGTVTAVVEKPLRPRSGLALTGAYFFTPAIHEAVRRVRPSHRGELEITDAIQLLIDDGHRVAAESFTGYWQDTGTVAGLLDCNRLVLDGIRSSVRGRLQDSTTQGPVVIEEGARVVRSHIVGPAIIGSGSVVRDSRLGSHVSVARGCHLTGVNVQDSVVLEGTTAGGTTRLRGSIIGPAGVCSVTGDQ